MIRKKLFSVLMAIAVFFFIITFSIGLPIYVRPFYYIQIEILDIENYSGFDRETIIEAYDAVLDYLTVPSKEFSTGDLLYSESGMAHFRDCKVLFTLNYVVFSISVIIIAVLKTSERKSCPYRLGKLKPEFYSASVLIFLICTVLYALIIDFDKVFELFHRLFFYGKENWIFSYDEDWIIRILPERFFMNCAILICISIIAFSLFIIISEILRINRKKT